MIRFATQIPQAVCEPAFCYAKQLQIDTSIKNFDTILQWMQILELWVHFLVMGSTYFSSINWNLFFLLLSITMRSICLKQRKAKSVEKFIEI